ncbi:MAG: tetraacyldisaccharide 4'-kinase [Steroidobacteraceae bacterium]|nr:tetraacyldisaccharide 4'-kinase [Steroidobacteraceae bacterium]
MNLQRGLEELWYGRASAAGRAVGAVLLAPPSWLFGAVAAARRTAYSRGWFAARRVPRPVVVVGNLTVGGSGKTPLTVWLVEWLQARGLRAGVVSRGYGGEADAPRRVTVDTPAHEAGDEPLLIARRTGAPVYVGRDRVACAELLAPEVDVVVADDGLQHYRLARDLEIVVVDGRRRFGNGRLLPAGPLREPPARLRSAGIVVANGGTPAPGELAMTLVPGDVVALADGTRGSLTAFAAASPGVHAVAGIGDPPRFFATLRGAGLAIEEHAFPDHATFTAGDLQFGDARPVLMTEKDAVKCGGFADPRLHYLEVSARFAPEDEARLGAAVLRALRRGGD